jgi:transcriptional regulator with XRE-family HTH domain
MTAVPQPRIGAPPVKREAAVALVRGMIADGTLKPGDVAPSGSELGRKADCHPDTAQDALRLLVKDGTLVRGVSKKSRLRVPQPGAELDQEAQKLIEAPSRALAALRRDRKMTQQDLADVLGVSIKTIERAEHGQRRQRRKFWQRAEAVLGGDLLRLFDTSGLPAVTVTPDSVLITWLDGTETLVRPPGRQGPEDSGAGPPLPGPRPGAVPAREGSAP